jgi:hypothetical protein
MNQKIFKIFFAFIFILLFCPNLISQQSGNSISGIVREAGSEEIIIGANVALYSDSLKSELPIRGAATNSFGYYSIPNIPPGKYYLFVSSIGYRSQSLILNTAETDSNRRLDFYLIKTAYSLDEVLVTETRTDFSNTTSTVEVNPEFVQKLPSFGGETDIIKALQLLPGVSASSEISTGLYVRGGSPDQNLTLIDGVTVYNPTHLGGFASTFNSDVLKRIKLIKGNFPAEYGGRLSSVLDITMREGTKEEFKGAAGINMISSRGTIEGPLSETSTFILSGRKMYLDRLLPLVKSFDNLPRYGFYDMNGKINYTVSEKNKIFISGFFSRDYINEPPLNQDVGFDIAWKNATLNLTWTSISSPSIFTNTSIMYTNYKFSTLIVDKNPTLEPLDFFTSSVINDILLRREMEIYYWTDHNIKAGVEILTHLFNTTTSDYFIKELQYRPNFGTDITAIEGAFYAQDEWKISESLQSNFGGRLYYFQTGKFLRFEPRLSLTYFLSDRLVFRTAGSIVHQTLHLLSRPDILLPTDIWYPSTETIEPAKSVQGSLGFEATSIDRSFLFTLEGYYKKLSNIYEYKPNADFQYQSNLTEQVTKGTGEAYGVEFFLNKRIGNFSGWIGYTLAWTRRHFEEINAGLRFYPRYDKRHDISFVTAFELASNLSIGATWVYGTGQAYALQTGQYSFKSLANPTPADDEIYYDYSARDAFRLPPFHKLDVSIKYKHLFGRNEIEFSLDVYNIYNRYNAFSKYIGYRLNEEGERVPLLKQFTIFPFLPTLGINFTF